MTTALAEGASTRVLRAAEIIEGTARRAALPSVGPGWPFAASWRQGDASARLRARPAKGFAEGWGAGGASGHAHAGPPLRKCVRI